MIVTAPDELRGLSATDLITTCASLRPDRTDAASRTTAVKIALRSPARRHQRLTIEITDLDELLEPLVTAISPKLVAAHGVGTAGQLAGHCRGNHQRLRSEAAFAMLCGGAPIPASFGIPVPANPTVSRRLLPDGWEAAGDGQLTEKVLTE